METTTAKRYSKEELQNICSTIHSQMGGNKFLTMTGSKIQYIQEDNGNASITYKLTRNKVGANFLKVTLNAMDVYDMEFILFRDVKKNGFYSETIRKVVATHENVYDDMLQGCFTSTTGLYTRL